MLTRHFYMPAETLNIDSCLVGPPGPSTAQDSENVSRPILSQTEKVKKSYLLNPTLWFRILRLENSQRPGGRFGWFWPKRQNASRTYPFTPFDLKIWKLMTIFISSGVFEVSIFMKMHLKADICQKRSKPSFLPIFQVFRHFGENFENWIWYLLPGNASQAKTFKTNVFLITFLSAVFRFKFSRTPGTTATAVSRFPAQPL